MKTTENIKTLDALKNYIDSCDEFPADVCDIITENGWNDLTGSEWDICEDGSRLLYFKEDGTTDIRYIETTKLEARDIILKGMLEYGNTYAVCLDSPSNNYCTTYAEMNEDLENEIWESSDFALFTPDEKPEAYEALSNEIVSLFEPANNVQDDGFDQMVQDLKDKNCSILYYKHNGTDTYILLW